jgi:protein TonB
MQQSTYNQTQSWNDLVFENRNKIYGAYRLREDYDRNIVIATIICAAIGVVVFFIPILLSQFGIKNTIVPSNTCGGLISPPFIKEPTIIKNSKTIKEAAVKSINKNLVAIVTTNTIVEVAIENPIESNSAGTDIGNTNSIIDEGNLALPIDMPALVKPKETMKFAEVMPAYEGGLESMYKFLNKQLRYPAIDRRLGNEGTVYVQFVIDEFGSVTQIEIVKGISATLDKEAMRVISLLPKWKPGMQNHETAPVKMVIPIKFKLTT